MAPLLEFRSGLRLAGHPVHTMLVHFPLALWFLVFPLEAAGWLGWEDGWRLAFWINAAAALLAVPTVLTGLADLTGIRNDAAAPVAVRHMIVMLCAGAAFGANLLVRGGGDPPQGWGTALAPALSLAGAVLLAVGGWLGGELIFRHGVGHAPEGG